MKFDLATQANRATRNLVLLLGASNVLMVIILLIVMTQLAGKDVEVRMLPPIPTTEEMEVARSHYNASYAENWAMFVASLVGNVNPENVEETTKLLSRIMSGRLEDELRESIRASIETMKIQGFRLSFRPQNVEYDTQTGITYVTGRMTENPVRGEPVTKTFTYEMRFRLRHGIPVLSHFQTYEGHPERS